MIAVFLACLCGEGRQESFGRGHYEVVDWGREELEAWGLSRVEGGRLEEWCCWS